MENQIIIDFYNEAKNILKEKNITFDTGKEQHDFIEYCLYMFYGAEGESPDIIYKHYFKSLWKWLIEGEFEIIIQEHVLKYPNKEIVFG